MWRGGAHDEERLLASCYERSIVLARERGLRSIAFPCISTGVFRYPAPAAARVAVTAVRRALEGNALPFDAAAQRILESALREIGG